MPETGRSQATNLKTQKQTKWIEICQSQVKMCFLRGPLRWLTERTNSKFLWTLQNAQRDAKNLAISRDFLGIQNYLSIFRVISFYASWKFLLWLGNSAWDFLGDKFWSSDVLGFWFLPPFDHPCHLKCGVPPSGLELSWKGRWIFHTFHPKLIYIFLIGNFVGESNEKTKPS